MIPEPEDATLREMEKALAEMDACDHDWQECEDWPETLECSKCGCLWFGKSAAGGE